MSKKGYEITMPKAAKIKKVADSTSKGKNHLPPKTSSAPSPKPTKAPNSGKSFKTPGPATTPTNLPVKGPKTGKR